MVLRACFGVRHLVPPRGCGGGSGLGVGGGGGVVLVVVVAVVVVVVVVGGGGGDDGGPSVRHSGGLARPTNRPTNQQN